MCYYGYLAGLTICSICILVFLSLFCFQTTKTLKTCPAGHRLETFKETFIYVLAVSLVRTLFVYIILSLLAILAITINKYVPVPYPYSL